MRLRHADAEKLGAQFAFINLQGEVVIPLEIIDDDSAPQFSEDLAPAMVNGKFGFADQTGKMVIPVSFSEAAGRQAG